MLKYVIFILLLPYYSIGQEIDSTYIQKYLNQEKYPLIDTVIYIRKTKRGKVVKEGWKIIENITPNSHFVRSSKYSDTLKGEYYVGIWKYYKRNRLTAIDTNIYKNGIMVSKQYRFRRNGNLKYCFIKKINYHEPKNGKVPKGRIWSNDFSNDETRILYNYKGQIRKKIVWREDELILEKKY